MTGPWGISIRTSKKLLMKVVSRKEGESPKMCLERAKKATLKIREKYADRDDVVVELISRSKAFAPKNNLKMGKGEVYCPYCRKPRRFKRGLMVECDGVEHQSDYMRCIICGISFADFWVRTYNDLWHVGPEGRTMKATRRKKG